MVETAGRIEGIPVRPYVIRCREHGSKYILGCYSVKQGRGGGNKEFNEMV